MKIIFAGTPPFAATALDALIRAGHSISMVLTQPDKASGRGMKTTPSAVKALAEQHGLPVLQPKSLRSRPDLEEQLRALEADIMVVAAYGLILPESVLNIPRLGCINIHASLLPRWRGAAPIQRAILAGDEKTGITLMQMNAGLDTGDILTMDEIPIEKGDTGQTLHDKLAALGAQCIVSLLNRDPGQRFAGKPQEEAGVCYAQKLEKAEARIAWSRSAAEIERMIRAFDPFPGAFCLFGEVPVKIWQASAGDEVPGKPGEIVEVGRDGILVACGVDSLRIEALQRPGGKRLSAAQFLSGFPLLAGSQLE